VVHCTVHTAGAAVAALACAAGASAGILNASASEGTRSASASFATSGTNLVVTLTNTAPTDITQPVFVLTAVFFDIGGTPLALTRSSALVNAGSTVINAAQPAGGVVGGEWAYQSALAGAPHGADYGIGSAGFNLFGPGDLFPGANLDGPASPNGLEYGITTANDDPATNNGGTNTPLIRNSVVFTLGGLPAGFDPMSRISNISFQYGTGLDEPNLFVPAPAAAGLLGLGLFARRRRR
jgi:hypothetical protein